MSWLFGLDGVASLVDLPKSKTTQNMILTGERVLNLASVDEVGAVNHLALTTGSDPVRNPRPGRNTIMNLINLGFPNDTNKSETIMAPLVQQCPAQLEAAVEAIHRVAEENPKQNENLICIEDVFSGCTLKSRY